jgi:hypothetical protein
MHVRRRSLKFHFRNRPGRRARSGAPCRRGPPPYEKAAAGVNSDGSIVTIRWARRGGKPDRQKVHDESAPERLILGVVWPVKSTRPLRESRKAAGAGSVGWLGDAAGL